MNIKSMEELERHVNILGWLHIGFNLLVLMVMFFVIMMMMGAGVLSGEAEAMGVMFFVSLMVGGFMLLMVVPGILAGWGLLKRKSWARVLALIIGILNIMSFPFGTAVGVYTIWVLLIHEESQSYFSNKVVPA